MDTTFSEALFLPMEQGYRLCVVHVPVARKPQLTLICVQPFAEEMNKSRRMISLAARALAHVGCAVIIVDLLGCGDSSGDHGDAAWQTWLHDIAAVRAWAAARYSCPSWLWGIRAGALLAVESGATAGRCNLLLWQPVLSGRQHLTQFLRLRVASDALAEAPVRSGTDALRDRLQEGEPQEIAGYVISPALARGLDAATLTLPRGFQGDIVWLEVSGQDPPALLPGSAALVQTWRAQGIRVHDRSVSGVGFWQTAEITECPALVTATCDMLMPIAQ